MRQQSDAGPAKKPRVDAKGAFGRTAGPTSKISVTTIFEKKLNRH